MKKILIPFFLICLTLPRVLLAQEGGELMVEDVEKFTEKECHKRFAIKLNNLVWDYLVAEDRTEKDNSTMVHAAHASCYHWGVVGEPINAQRGEWLISHVYAVLNRSEPALFHAKKCMALTEEHTFVDFDLAYAYEAMARAHAASGDTTEAEKYIDLAQKAGEKIKNDEDKKYFLSDFAAEPWYGVK